MAAIPGTPRPFEATRLASALPDFALGAAFLIAWVAPATMSPATLRWLVFVMLVEFIVVHSAAFMGRVAMSDGPRERRALAMLGLGAFYTLFAGGFALMARSAWPLVSFWMLTLNRMLYVLLDRRHEVDQARALQASWAAGALFYVGFAGLTLVPFLPRFGWTPDVLRALELPGSGVWVDQPWRPLAFGFLYFTATGLAELNGYAAFGGGLKDPVWAPLHRARRSQPRSPAVAETRDERSSRERAA